jgi:alkylhydroperoxidase/carboxymuconolactone decarboxylase family protein YurZ
LAEKAEEANTMSREEIYRELEKNMGEVPRFFRELSDTSLQIEYETMKIGRTHKSVVPQKYLELVGLGVSAAQSSRLGVLWHREMAKAYGATDAEIQETLYFSKVSVGWTAFIEGLDYDYGDYRKEVENIAKRMREQLKLAA